MKQRVSMILAAFFVALLGGQASAQSNQSLFGFLPFVPVGAVYTMSNAADSDAVLIFERSFDGRLRGGCRAHRRHRFWWRPGQPGRGGPE